MDWQDMAVERLEIYDAMAQALQNIPQELAQLKTRGANKPGSDAYMNAQVLRRELQDRLRRTRHWLKVMDRGLSALSPEERMIVNLLYIYPDKGNVDKLCQALQCEQATVYRRRNRALRKFTAALYGIGLGG